MFLDILSRKYQLVFSGKKSEGPVKGGAIFGVKCRVFSDISHLQMTVATVIHTFSRNILWSKASGAYRQHGRSQWMPFYSLFAHKDAGFSDKYVKFLYNDAAQNSTTAIWKLFFKMSFFIYGSQHVAINYFLVFPPDENMFISTLKDRLLYNTCKYSCRGLIYTLGV